MKKNGFTIIELLASFTLTMIIVVFLFEIVLTLKNIYINEAMRTTVISQNALIASKINNEINKITVPDAENNVKVNCSSNTCVIYGGGTENVIITIGETDVDLNGTKYSYPEDTKISSLDLNVNQQLPVADEGNDDSILQITYKITGKSLNKDVSFNYVYLYGYKA